MSCSWAYAHLRLHYRIGSLEIFARIGILGRYLHYRTGSLEKDYSDINAMHMLHYRTGSLKSLTTQNHQYSGRYLIKNAYTEINNNSLDFGTFFLCSNSPSSKR